MTGMNKNDRIQKCKECIEYISMETHYYDHYGILHTTMDVCTSDFLTDKNEYGVPFETDCTDVIDACDRLKCFKSKTDK